MVPVPVSGLEYQSVMTGILRDDLLLVFFLLQHFSVLCEKSSILRVLVVTFEFSPLLLVRFALVMVLLEVLVSWLLRAELLVFLGLAPVDCCFAKRIV